MPSTTAKGVPYALGTDTADTLDTTIQSLAEWVDARPGVSALTTAQRDALAGADLWNGRIIQNTTTGRLERWSSGAAMWISASEARPEIETLVARPPAEVTGITVHLASGATGDAIDIRDSGGVRVGGFAAGGEFRSKNIKIGTVADPAPGGWNGFVAPTDATVLHVTGSGATHAAPLMEFRRAPGGGALTSIRYDGGITGPGASFTGHATPSGHTIRAIGTTPSSAIVSVLGAAAQTAPALEVIPSGASVTSFHVHAAGGIKADTGTVSGDGRYDHNFLTPGGNSINMTAGIVRVAGRGAGAALEVTGASGQTRMQQWYDAVKTDVAHMTNLGSLIGRGIAANTELTDPRGVGLVPHYGIGYYDFEVGANNIVVAGWGGMDFMTAGAIRSRITHGGNFHHLDSDGGQNFQARRDGLPWARRGMALAYGAAPTASAAEGRIYVTGSGALRFLRADGSDYYITG